MKGYGANGKPQRVVSRLEIGLVLILIGSMAGVGFYVHDTLSRVRKELPGEILGQAGELTILIQELAGLAYAAELAVLEPKVQRRDALIIHNNAVLGRLAAIRTSYVFDNLVGAAAIHALVNPASEDIQRWLIHGLPGFSPDSPTIMRLVGTRARDALARARDLSLQGSTTALTLLNQGAMRLEAFRTGMLIMLALLVLLTLVVIGLFFSRQRATARLATLRAHLADAIENITEGFILCDAEDRVVVCNEQYRRMYSILADKILPGVPFRELAQGFLQTRLIMGVDGREVEALDERMARHLNPGQPFEHELRDGRRLRISERRTRNGGIVGIHTDMTDVRKVQERLHHLATHDVLTGLPNRAFCQENMERVMAQARRRGLGFAILYLDLDRFKMINDTLGHHAGDEVLRAVAKRLKSQLRDEDILARLGGDEFIVILDDFAHFPSAQVLAQRFLKALSEPFQTSAGQEVFVSTSIGVAHFPEDGDNIDTLMRNADAASYRAKSQGPNNYALYTSDINAEIFERMQLENDLRHSLTQGELLLLYQPRVDMARNGVVAVQALLRWRHRERGLLRPESFMSLAEETGLIIPIGEWALHQACDQYRLWRLAGLSSALRMSVNLSARQLYQADLKERIEGILRATDMRPEQLELEITESALMEHMEAGVASIKELGTMGLQLTMGGFGTGCCSLGVLKRVPLTALKIDHSFVGDITADHSLLAIVSAIIAMGRALQLRVVAEGVENQDQLALLRERGCVEAQGNYFSPPLSAEQCTGLLRDRLGRP